MLKVFHQENKNLSVKLQVDENTTKRAICYDMNKVTKLQQKKSSCEPLKLKNVLIEKPSCSNPNFAEIIINSSCEITEPLPADVTFKRNEPPLTITALDDLDQSKIDELVSLKGRVSLGGDDHIRVVTSFGRKCKLSDSFISDQSKTMPITLWNESICYFNQKAEEGLHHFKIFNLIVKYYDSKGLYLSTCSDTFAEEFEPDENIVPNLPNVVSEERLTITEFDTVGKFVYGFICKKCFKIIVAGGTKTIVVRCSSCGTSYKSDKLQRVMKVEVGSPDLEENPYIINHCDLIKIWPDIMDGEDMFSLNENNLTERILTSIDIKVLADHRNHVLKVDTL